MAAAARPATAPPPRDRHERRGGGYGADRPAHAGPGQRGERREEHRVAEHVVAAVPLGVPDGHPLGVEQPRAEGMGGHVGGGRADGQVDGSGQRRARHGAKGCTRDAHMRPS